MNREIIIRKATAEDGTKEDPPETNKTKYGEWYGLNGVKWCAIFVSWVYKEAGVPLGMIDSHKGFHYCQSAYNHWKRMGELTKDPKAGDIVLFDWQGDGHCDHTGIFEGWIDEHKTKFHSWEGNTSAGNDNDGGKVMRRTRSRSVVKAFVSPKVLGNPSPPVGEDDYLQQGERGAVVSLLQKRLYKLGYKVAVDGIFGPHTELAVLQFQRDNGLQPTGIVTPAVEGALQEELAGPKVVAKKMRTGSHLRKDDAGAAVLALQQALNAAGIQPQLAVDGVFGRRTLAALKDYQKKNKLQVDGIAGPATLSTLQVEQV